MKTAIGAYTRSGHFHEERPYFHILTLFVLSYFSLSLSCYKSIIKQNIQRPTIRCLYIFRLVCFNSSEHIASTVRLPINQNQKTRINQSQFTRWSSYHVDWPPGDSLIVLNCFISYAKPNANLTYYWLILTLSRNAYLVSVHTKGIHLLLIFYIA